MGGGLHEVGDVRHRRWDAYATIGVSARIHATPLLFGSPDRLTTYYASSQ
jgi:hypothetical protein